MFAFWTFSTLIVITSGALLPSNFPRCYQVEYYKNEMEYSDCIVKAGHEAKEILRQGIPKLGIPSINGIVIPKIDVEQKSRAFQYVISLSNLTVSGLDKYIINEIKYTKEDRSYRAIGTLPEVNLKGNYYIWGKIFDQNINQTGPATAKIYNTTMKVYLLTNLYDKKGVTFMNLTKVEVDVNVGNATGKFDNLFGNAETLNRAVNAFLEQSTIDIVNTALPDFKQVLSDLFVAIINPLTKVVPYDNIFYKKEQ